MNGLTWLNDLMTWVSRWVPRLVLVKAGECALWFGRRGSTRELTPGLHWYWPITSEVTVISSKLRTLECCGQTNDREVLALVLRYRVTSPKALLVWNSIPANLDDRSAAHLAEAYSPERSSRDIGAAVTEALRAEFDAAGVEILDVKVAQRAPVRVLRLMNDWATHESSRL